MGAASGVSALPRAGAARVVVNRSLLVGATAFVTIAALSFANGGYFPVSWGWSALGLLWLAGILLVARADARLGVLEAVYLGLVAMLTGWIFLSSTWTTSVTETIFEGERAIVYVAAALAILLLVRPGSRRMVLLGTWGAISIVCLYGLATRLFPNRFDVFDPISGYRLSEPVGYWNGLGLLAAMGALLALGFAAREGPTLRSLAAASTVVLVPTIYFTFSRGAWVALFVGLAASIALDRRRLQLITTALVLAPWPAIGVLFASQSDALTKQTTSLSAAAKDGHGLAAILIGLATLSALAALAYEALEANVRVSQSVRRAFAGTLIFALLAVAIAVTGTYGTPPTIAKKVWSSFKAPPPQTHGNLSGRLFNLSGNTRVDQWRVAWHDYKAHPWLGSGAGTYAEYWFEKRPVAGTVHDAHSLYLETLAETGPVGLALLIGWLGLPLLVAIRRRDLITAAPFGAYVAYLAHAAVDWDWELPAVTLVAIVCGVVLLRSGSQSQERSGFGIGLRAAGVAAALAIGAFTVMGLLGNSADSASSKAAQAGNFAKAQTQARRARRFAPWSSEPWRRLGEAQYGRNDLANARISYRRAIAKEPRDWTLWYELALASKGAAARRALAQAQRLNPLSPEIASYRRSQQQ